MEEQQRKGVSVPGCRNPREHPAAVQSNSCVVTVVLPLPPATQPQYYISLFTRQYTVGSQVGGQASQTSM